MSDPTLTLSADASEPSDHEHCHGESSSSVDMFQADTAQQNAAQWPLVDDTTGSGSQVFDTMAGAWTFIALSPQTAQVALDAVRYRANYARTVTSRLCLHYVNSIRKRVTTTGITSYLYSVDGCMSSQLVETGRCDIYYCRPYTYELQLTQKAAASDVYIVTSIYKTVGQKTLAELREESNLDWSFDPTADAGTGEDPSIKQAETPLQTEEPLAWQENVGAFLMQGSNFFADEQPIAWTSDGNNLWGSQATTTTQQVTAEPLSLRAEPLSEPQKEFASDTNSGATAVAVIGIAAVAVSTIAFFLAIVMVRWRSRKNATQCGGNDEYSPLRSTLNTAENTVSLSCRDSIGGAETKADIEKVEFFG